MLLWPTYGVTKSSLIAAQGVRCLSSPSDAGPRVGGPELGRDDGPSGGSGVRAGVFAALVTPGFQQQQ